MIHLLLILQASTISPAPANIEFDLRTAPSHDDTIIVTGRRPPKQRIFQQYDGAGKNLVPRAEVRFIGKSRIGIEVRQEALSGGAVSNRAMVTIKAPF